MKTTNVQNQSSMECDNSRPQLFAWLASTAIISQIIVIQFLPQGGNVILRASGVGVLITAALFIFSPFYLLAKHGNTTFPGTYMQTRKVVHKGPYALIRHPQYLGYMLLAVGFSLLWQHWVSVLLAIFGVTGFTIQAVQEENYCLARFGEPYARYMQQVPRFNILASFGVFWEKPTMIELRKAYTNDVEILTKIQIRTFVDDNKNKPAGCSLEGPPGYNSLKWNTHWIQHTPYYKILSHRKIVGGLILFDLGDSHFEVGRIWVDPKHQNQGIGQAAMKMIFELYPDVKKWTLGTPSWAIRNQHFYEKMGFVRLGETEVDPKLGWSGIEYELICGNEK